MRLFLQILVGAVAGDLVRIVTQDKKGIRHTVPVCVSSCFVEYTRTFLPGSAGTWFLQD